MNDRLPPIDPDLREQLARRAAGRVPETLLAETYARLDAAPRRARGIAPRALQMPGLALTAAGLAAALLLVVAVALPAFRTNPAGPIPGYPAERPLTTSELADVMAGPPLAVNTALVASVTIQARTDVCPMNRYPTLGVIEGMGSQVCVMGAGVYEYLTSAGVSGTFAFRYLAPGVLGLLAEVTPASSGLAFGVAQDWPLTGKAFLVRGYLGLTKLSCPEETAVSPGDPLNPNGDEQCAGSWLSDDGSPAPVRSFPTWAPTSMPSPGGSVDLLKLTGKARLVQAGGARLIDSIPDATTLGVYVVKPATGPCPGAAPYSSVGCPVWRVLAKVPELSLQAAPTATAAETMPKVKPPNAPVSPPSPTPLPAGVGLIGPGGRPLTTAELMQAWAADPNHLAGRIAIVDGGIPTNLACSSANASPYVGDACDVLIGLAAPVAVRVGSGGGLSIVGQLALPTSSGVVFAVTDACSDRSLAPGAFLVVSGVLVQQGGTWRIDHTGTVDASATCASIDLGAGAYESMAPPSQPINMAWGPKAFYLVQVGSPWTLLTRLEPLAGQG